MRSSAVALLVLAAAANAQPLNVDLGLQYASPADTYAAAAQPGFWNATNGDPLDLLDVNAEPSGVTLSFPMGAGAGFVNDPFLVGDVHALLDDAFLTGDVVQRARFENLENGLYDVVAYTAPIGDVTTFFIEAGDESQFFNIPGDWNGDLEEGVNFAIANVDVDDGTLNVDWVGGIFGGTGWLSGIQIVPACGCAAADINCDGNLDILDFVAFQGLFLAQDPVADCDGNDIFNILDFVCFQAAFQKGCP